MSISIMSFFKKIFLIFVFASLFIGCNYLSTEQPKSTKQYHSPTAEEYCESGTAKYKLNNYTEAILDFTKSIELNPNNADAYLLRGNAQIFTNDFDRALQDCNKAILLSPNNVLAYTCRGNVKMFSKDFEGAKDDYSKVIELKPNDTTYFVRGSAEYRLKDYIGAFRDYNEAIKRNPNYGEAYYGRGILKVYLHYNESGCLDLVKAKNLGMIRADDDINKYCQ